MSRFARIGPSRVARGPLAALWALPLAWGGCGTNDPVVAVVGSTRLRQSDVALQGDRSRAGGASLDELLDRARLAEAARGEGLANDPEVRARLAAAEREVLAVAYMERQLKGADDVEALKVRYDKDKNALRRRSVHVRQIVVLVESGGDRAAAEKGAWEKARTLYARVRGGEDFQEIARRHSDDKPTAARGGELPVIQEGSVAPEIFAAAVALKRDQVSEPVKTAFGFHLLQAVEDATEAVPTFEEARSRLAAEARRQVESETRARVQEKVHAKILDVPKVAGK